MTTSTPPVVFDDATWIAMFPEFSALTPAQGNAYFMQAGLICANSCSNPIFAGGTLPALLYLLTSHIAWLNCPKDANGNPAATGAPASSLVGRISNASEGSVSVATEWNGSGSPNEAWFIQTRYGAQYWTATAQYRTARYLANPTRVINGVYPGMWR
jgi:hypothetical protein